MLQALHPPRSMTQTQGSVLSTLLCHSLLWYTIHPVQLLWTGLYRPPHRSEHIAMTLTHVRIFPSHVAAAIIGGFLNISKMFSLCNLIVLLCDPLHRKISPHQQYLSGPSVRNISRSSGISKIYDCKNWRCDHSILCFLCSHTASSHDTSSDLILISSLAPRPPFSKPKRFL